MKRKRVSSKVFFGGLLIAITTTALISADEPAQKANARVVVIACDDIGVKAEIHGKLDLPLGRLSTIQGRCVTTENRKEYADRSTFRIERVNSAVLDRPVELLLNSFGPGEGRPFEVGRTYELRGYEHGQFHGVPDEAYKEYIRGGKPAFATLIGYTFRTEFVYLSAKGI